MKFFSNTNKLKFNTLSLFFLGLFFIGNAQNKYVTSTSSSRSFSVASKGKAAPLYVSSEDHAGVQRVVGHLQNDIKEVTTIQPLLITNVNELPNQLIIIGSLDKSPIIQQLVKKGKIKGSQLEGKWEKFIIQTVKNPLPGVKQALVIAGSDKRGTIFGIYDLSQQIGVHPWHYWADMPILKQTELHVTKGIYTLGEPKVKYRGIFINDEAPALRNWAKEKFGDFNHEFYETVFELILRNKGNYLWPAMWQPSSFVTDDPENTKLANEYGIVISTTHHEPMMRAHAEWDSGKNGPWNYETNKEKLQEFWKEGIKRMGDNESVVTLGMRGDGDEAMSEDTAIDLMKNIIEDQRTIIADVTGKPVEETAQVWALYKEVQDYYDKGMRVDEDIIVLFCDDNWGNVRILPKKEDLNENGKFGMYYHFDFVGGPVSYRWLNVSQIERVWEQMNLTYERGVKDLWLVNVGDIKPMELPISFFLDFAWNPDMKAQDLPNYYVNWLKPQFGEELATEIADILALSTKYSARRTPEMLKPDTYSLENYREADKVLEDYKKLLVRSENIYNKLPETHKSAFYQLVHFPIAINSNLNEMYVAAGKNQLYGQQGRASTNYYADVTRTTFFKDAELVKEYHEMADGRWNHMMSQTHIGYTSWNNPPFNKMPSVNYLQLGDDAQLGYVLEYGERSRRNRFGLFSRSFSTFDPINNQNYYIEIFNRGTAVLDYTVTTKNDWIKLSSQKGSIQYDEKVYVSIDWDKAPKGEDSGEITVSSSGRDFAIKVPIQNDFPVTSGFIENNGVVAIEAAHYTKKIDSKNIHWTVIPNMGRTNSAITIEPASADQQTVGAKTPRLEYEFTVFNNGDLKIDSYLSPTLNYKKNEGLKYAIAIDDETPQIINMHKGETVPDWEYPDWWNNSVTDHIKKKQSTHQNIKSGTHTLKIWMIDPGIVFQKFVIDAGGLKDSYLGPPESVFITKK